ncbi:MAG: HK97 gp10 family phage protein [Candidatus Hydrogenedentes bacterium]|nr:HK97 gp10 family phage protein [Candidatus Hydrogenedentota bacterium]
MARNSKLSRLVLTGDKELIAKLNGLGGRVYRKVVARASRKAFAPVAKDAKAKAPKETGLLKKSMGVKQKRYPRAGRIITLVGPRTGFATDVTVNTPSGERTMRRDPVKYAHLVEYGTAPHSIKIGDGEPYQHPGGAPKPFMRPAFDNNESRAKQIMRSELAAGVVREAKSK